MANSLEFEWDSRKATANLKKHGVDFHEAATVFEDPLAITFDDPRHSIGEERYLTYGLSQRKRLIVVSHAEREDRIRVISARPMSSIERKIYEKG